MGSKWQEIFCTASDYPARKGVFEEALPIMKFKCGDSKLRVIPFDLDESFEGEHSSFIENLIGQAI